MHELQAEFTSWMTIRIMETSRAALTGTTPKTLPAGREP